MLLRSRTSDSALAAPEACRRAGLQVIKSERSRTTISSSTSTSFSQRQCEAYEYPLYGRILLYSLLLIFLVAHFLLLNFFLFPVYLQVGWNRWSGHYL